MCHKMLNEILSHCNIIIILVSINLDEIADVSCNAEQDIFSL